MTKRLMIVALLLILLFGTAPALSALGAGAIASLFGCALDEGSIHPCMAFGHDIGDMLYTMFVLGWFAMVTFPLGALALLAWIVVALILLVVHWRRRRTA
jgi:hypothetical protein